jgi:hypothetical protein
MYTYSYGDDDWRRSDGPGGSVWENLSKLTFYKNFKSGLNWPNTHFNDSG